MRSPSVCDGCGGSGRARPRDADAGSGPRAERERRSGARGCEGPGAAGGRLMLEAFRDGGPRKREGGGGRCGW